LAASERRDGRHLPAEVAVELDALGRVVVEREDEPALLDARRLRGALRQDVPVLPRERHRTPGVDDPEALAPDRRALDAVRGGDEDVLEGGGRQLGARLEELRAERGDDRRREGRAVHVLVVPRDDLPLPEARADLVAERSEAREGEALGHAPFGDELPGEAAE